MQSTKYIKAESARVAEPSDYGTTFYKVTESQLKDALNNSKDVNLWVKAVVDRDGFRALNFKSSLFGSKVIGNTLYLCKTDGSDIEVNGKSVDPETALDQVSLSALSDYIDDADDDIICKSITEYELDFKDIEKLAIELLRENYAFNELYDAATEIGLAEKG